ncbi:MAG: hypothetical protein HQL06_02995 [Nitrospirae bacterium]|uniref:Magnetosome protein Mad25 n=1 Tax=uncultured Nitrospirota bacterium TaxID=170969 RepID=A0A142BTY3_9BACT|nr:magnetosome protein Mad25 [uncultured Nitrospirota bacterium]MBF0343174.1 hypothetical protein [Nitrospirota bacterium]
MTPTDMTAKEMIDLSDTSKLTVMSNPDAEALEFPFENKTQRKNNAMMTTPLLSGIKGIEFLKETISTVDVEKTINDMFAIISNMEQQLNNVLSINALLDKDLRGSKEIISDLRREKLQAEKELQRITDETATREELQAEIEHLIDERNFAQSSIGDMKREIDTLKRKELLSRERVEELEGERTDLIREINYMELKYASSIETIGRLEKEIRTLRGERIVTFEKLKSLKKNAPVSDKITKAE